MKPLQWLGLIAVIITLAMVCGWFLSIPECPDVPGYKDKHPTASCR
jgi:hypothetical protein